MGQLTTMWGLCGEHIVKKSFQLKVQSEAVFVCNCISSGGFFFRRDCLPFGFCNCVLARAGTSWRLFKSILHKISRKVFLVRKIFSGAATSSLDFMEFCFCCVQEFCERQSKWSFMTLAMCFLCRKLFQIQCDAPGSHASVLLLCAELFWKIAQVS